MFLWPKNGESFSMYGYKIHVYMNALILHSFRHCPKECKQTPESKDLQASQHH